MSEQGKQGIRISPGSAAHYEAIANAIDDDDVYNSPMNYFWAGYYYKKAAKEGEKEGRK